MFLKDLDDKAIQLGVIIYICIWGTSSFSVHAIKEAVIMAVVYLDTCIFTVFEMH